jgi:hypothetical protein
MGVDPVILKRAVVTPLASAKGLSVEEEAMAAGSTSTAGAYGFVAIGADLVVSLCDPDLFPSTDRRTKRRGTKWLGEGILAGRGGRAAIYLAQAFALGMEWLQKLAGDEYSSAMQRQFRELIQRQYPLDESELASFDQLGAMYRMMETHEVPDGWSVLEDTGYIAVLRDPNYFEGGPPNPDDDERLVETHKNTAGTYLRSTARLDAMKMTLGDGRYDKLEDKLMTPKSMSAYRLELDLNIQAGWGDLGERWRSHAEMVLVPAVDADAEPLPSDLANYLRRRTMSLLLQPRSSIGDVAEVAIERYVSDYPTGEPSWSLMTDGVITGYCLRRGEEELEDHYLLNAAMRASLAATAATEPNRAMQDGLHEVVADVQSIYSGDAESWLALRDWAGRETVARSVGRRELDMEAGETDLTEADAARAFDFGYGVRVVEMAIYGEERAMP